LPSWLLSITGFANDWSVPLLGVHAHVQTTAMPKAITCVGLDISLSD
jgi:hypothetical protein